MMTWAAKNTINDGQGWWCVSHQFFFTCSQYDKVTNVDGGIVIGYTLDKGHGPRWDCGHFGHFLVPQPMLSIVVIF